MTGRRKGKEELAEPCALSYDSRQAASATLCEIADRMMRGAQSLMRKSARVLSCEPEQLGHLIGDLRRYGGSVMPCADEMVAVEAILKGLPEDQCRTERRQRIEKKEDEAKEAALLWERRREGFDRVERKIQEILDTITGRPLPGHFGESSRIFWQLLDGKGPKPVRASRHNEANVVEGPWGEAS